ILCCLKESRLSSGEIAEQINLTCSNTSKLIRSVEEKGYIKRVLGDKDKRQMYFVLTKEGKKMLSDIEERDLEISYPLSRIIDLQK
ncbi:MAG: MarR family transcriptional regulator, partial [Bacteroidales bacterium]|nr:MarR family transcriptional regulator [Bacteroidales bacterium]